MKHDLLQLAAELSRRGEPFALATVVNREPPISAQVGDVAIVTQGGEFHGWVGGTCTRPTVIAEAARALADGRPRFIALDPQPGPHERKGLSMFPMTCHSGGSVEIYIQPVLPAPRLLVFGISPTAQALARLGKAMGYTVVAVDPHADAAAFPTADATVTDPAGAGLKAAGPAQTFAVVATQGQWDEEALLAAAGLQAAYLAVVASPKRFGEMRAFLAGHLAEPVLRAVKNPAGLDLGARGPEEVALSILAEIVKERRQGAPEGMAPWGSGGEAAQRREAPSAARPDPLGAGMAPWGSGGEAAQRREAPSAARPDPLGAGIAKDPICGMTVAVAGARHRAEHGGREYFFCCAGCREKFLVAPERYAQAGAGGR